MKHDDTLIYDFETLGVEPTESVVVSFAALTFNKERMMASEYKYNELLADVKYMKFDTKDQIENHGRKVDQDTLNWWKKQGPEALKELQPSSSDEPIKDFPQFLFDCMPTYGAKTIYTRNNTFDPAFAKYLCRTAGGEIPYKEWVVRDTKSTIDGMTWGVKGRDNFIPPGLEEGFIAHDPRHDIVMDVMRLQYLSNQLLGDEPPWDHN